MEKPQPPIDSIPQNPLQPVFELLQGGDSEAICTKYGITPAELDKQLKAYKESQRQVALQDQLSFLKLGRNDPCSCGSGKKYKKCCLPKHEEARTSLPPDQLHEMEEQAKLQEKLEKDVQRGFDLLFSQNFSKARDLALNLLETFPEDDRVHDIAITAALALGEYDSALSESRRCWQMDQDERNFYKQNGYHKKEGQDRKESAHSLSPWLDKLWIAQKACDYSLMYPLQEGSSLEKTVSKLKVANDVHRFPARGEEGVEARRKALAPVIHELEQEGPAAIPYLLPLTYNFSWATLFVPNLLRAYGTDESLRLLAELSMFRFPYFCQECLVSLDSFGERAVSAIKEIFDGKPMFDELKVGLILILSNIRTPESFELLARLTDHENPYVVNWAAQALGKHQNPEALSYLEKAKERLGVESEIGRAIQDLIDEQNL